MKEKLISEIARVLYDKKKLSIPQLCEILGIEDEFVVIEAVGKLEKEGSVELNGFKTIYREDGGEIHLALYSLTE